MPTSMPRPPNLPCVATCSSLNASASRKSECGSRSCTMPLIALMDELVVGDRLDVIALDAPENRGQELQVLVGDRQLGVALREHREIEAQQHPEHRAEPDQARLLPAIAHVTSHPKFRSHRGAARDASHCTPPGMARRPPRGRLHRAHRVGLRWAGATEASSMTRLRARPTRGEASMRLHLDAQPAQAAAWRGIPRWQRQAATPRYRSVASECPVISGGCGMSIKASIVGAMSCSAPLAASLAGRPT